MRATGIGSRPVARSAPESGSFCPLPISVESGYSMASIVRSPVRSSGSLRRARRMPRDVLRLFRGRTGGRPGGADLSRTRAGGSPIAGRLSRSRTDGRRSAVSLPGAGQATDGQAVGRPGSRASIGPRAGPETSPGQRHLPALRRGASTQRRSEPSASGSTRAHGRPRLPAPGSGSSAVRGGGP